MLGGLFSACADTKTALSNRKRISLAGALLEVQASRTETEVIERLGPPNSTGNFDPGNKADPNIVNRFPRKEWADLYVFVPPTLIETLPSRTKILFYFFDYGEF